MRGHSVAVIEVPHLTGVERNGLLYVAIHADGHAAVFADDRFLSERIIAESLIERPIGTDMS